jgi:phosphatidylglycerophosphate synthase
MIVFRSRADALTSVRFVCGILIVAGLAAHWSPAALVTIVLVAWLSDLVDGTIARHDGTQSAFGAQLDQWADASFHAMTALGWILVPVERTPLLLAAVWLHGLGAAMNPLAFPAATIPVRAAKIVGGSFAFLIDTLLVSQTIERLPVLLVFVIPCLAFVVRLAVLVRRGILVGSLR